MIESRNHNYEPDNGTKTVYRAFVKWIKPKLIKKADEIINSDEPPDSVLRKATDLVVDYKVDPEKVFDELIDEVSFCWFMRSLAWQYMRNKGITDLELLDACHAYHHSIDLFQAESDYTEDVYLIDDEMVKRLGELPLDNIFHLGWLYQYYNSDVKDAYYAAKKKAETSKEIAAATGIYTPYWVVRYMLENSLGRLWINHLGTDEEETAKNFGWSYYLPKAEQPVEVQRELEAVNETFRKLKPEDILFLEPSMGTGLILLSAFDMLVQIYESSGINPKDAVRTILEKNLYGVDIDTKVWRIAKFSLMMRAAEIDPTILKETINFNLTAPVIDGRDVDPNKIMWFGTEVEGVERIKALVMIQMLCDDFEIIRKVGSLAIPRPGLDINLMRRYINSPEDVSGLEATQFQINNLLDLLDILTKKYHCVVTNPPYLGSKNYDDDLKTFFDKKGYIKISPEMDPWEDVYKPALISSMREIVK